MSDNGSLLSKLEKETSTLISAYIALKEENSFLKEELKQTKQKLAESKAQTRELEEINKEIKVVNAMLGSEEHRRLMKLKINKLIREVDTCISEVKNRTS